LLGGESCFDQVMVQQRGSAAQLPRLQIIVPRANFTCNGRITSVTASLERNAAGVTEPYFEMWRPTTPYLDVYNKVGEVRLVESKVVEVVDNDNNTYWLVNVTLNDDDRIEFEAGDVIGYYHPPDTRYRVWSVVSMGYRIVANELPNASNTISLFDKDISLNNRRPLIQVTFGMSIICCN